MKGPPMRPKTALMVFTAAFAPAVAEADVQHVIARGHTIQAIANRYHVPVKAIMEANHLKDAKHLKPGDVLTIPVKKDPAQGKPKAEAGAKATLAKPLSLPAG